MIYNWQTNSDGGRTLTLDGREFWAFAYRHGNWNLSEFVASEGVVRRIADEVNWNDIDLALQQFIGGN